MFSERQKEKVFTRNPDTGVILGAESFVVGTGKHALLMIHGWGSSPREMKVLTEKLSVKYTCYGIRLHGHGTTPNDLIPYTWEDHFKQVLELYSQLSESHENVSVIGFSYGAILALHLASRRKVHQLILLAPFIESPKTIGGIKENRLVPFLPDGTPNIPKTGKGPIFDPTESKKHIIYHTMPVKSLKTVVECVSRIKPLFHKVCCPTLILHSIHDQTAHFEGAVTILKAIASEDKALIALNHSNHVITLDRDRKNVKKQVQLWLRSHSP